jgi:hypothetical protein
MSQLLEENSIAKLSLFAGLAITDLYTVPVGKSLMIEWIIVRVSSFTAGSKTVQAVASVGANSATYDDYLNSVTFTFAGLTFTRSSTATQVPLYTAGQIVKMSIETGSNATTELWAVSIWGHLI